MLVVSAGRKPSPAGTTLLAAGTGLWHSLHHAGGNSWQDACNRIRGEGSKRAITHGRQCRLNENSRVGGQPTRISYGRVTLSGKEQTFLQINPAGTDSTCCLREMTCVDDKLELSTLDMDTSVTFKLKLDMEPLRLMPDITRACPDSSYSPSFATIFFRRSAPLITGSIELLYIQRVGGKPRTICLMSSVALPFLPRASQERRREGGCASARTMYSWQDSSSLISKFSNHPPA